MKPGNKGRVTCQPARVQLRSVHLVAMDFDELDALDPVDVPELGRAISITVLGATGFTGGLIVQHLDALSTNVPWAIAGRNLSKLRSLEPRLRALYKTCSGPLPATADVRRRSFTSPTKHSWSTWPASHRWLTLGERLGLSRLTATTMFGAFTLSR